VYRFFALVWNFADPQQSSMAGQLALRLQRATAGWQNVLAAPGVSAFQIEGHARRNDAYALADSAGVVLGKLFDRQLETPPRAVPLSLSRADSERIASSGGRHLLEHFWGSYVAVLRDPASGRVRVLRDPSGSLPCFVTTCQGVSIFFSDIEDCLAVGLLSFSINWKYLAACAAYIALKIGATGLNEVTEILQGQAADVGPTGIDTMQLWNPVEYARDHMMEDPAAAIAEAEGLIKGCIGAWASCHDSMLVLLSGGLDSSIVMRALAQQSPSARLTALNHGFASGSSCDERRFARLAVEGTACTLRERMLDTRSVDLESLLGVSRSPKPWFYFADLVHGSFERHLAREVSATAVFSGNGGDHVFMQNGATDAVGDFLYHHGLFHPRLLSVLRDAALITRTAAWSLLRAGRHQAQAPQEWTPVASKYLNQFISREVLEEFRANPAFARPPALGAMSGVPTGKIRHIENLLSPHPFYWAFQEPDAPARVAPLFSQPILELALRLPTYVLIHGGWDRAIERSSMERNVPTQIIRRRAKGVSDNAVKELMENNIEFIRELLLDGLLVRERVLDRKKLEAFLCGSRKGARTEYNELYVTRICSEVWLRRWQALERRAAA
jgi:asparagine synthase (glutamine-hydrolysing)